MTTDQVRPDIRDRITKLQATYPDDEFGEQTWRCLARHHKGLQLNHAEGTAQTWFSAGITFARWLETTRAKQIPTASQVDVDDYFEMVTSEYWGTTAGGKVDGVFFLYEYLDRKNVCENVAAALDREMYDLEGKGERTKQAKVLRQQDDYIAISREEVENLWDDENVPSPALRNTLLIKILWFTGCRASEVVDIRIAGPNGGDMDREEGKITIHDKKTTDWRSVWYPPNRLEYQLTEWLDYGGRDALSPYAEESDYLFLTHQSEQMRPSHVSRIVKNAARNAGINEKIYEDDAGKDRWLVTGHTIRHSMASYHANILETPIHILSDVLGHENLETTLKYIDDDEETKRRKMQDPWQ